MRPALLVLAAAANAQLYGVAKKERAKFDHETGAPLNAAARAILARHRESSAAVVSQDASATFDAWRAVREVLDATRPRTYGAGCAPSS